MTYPRANIRCDAADFDGTNDYMSRGADLSGNADGKTGTVSFWFRMDGGNGAAQYLLSNSTDRFLILRQTNNTLTVAGKDSADAVRMLADTTATFTAGATWNHIAVSWDLAAGPAIQMYLNGVSHGSVSGADANIDYTAADWTVGAAGGGNKFNGCMAEIWFSKTRIDLSTGIKKFRSAGGKPVHLGATGALPTGTAPIVYLHLDDGEAVANFATNRGTGGNFTITGTLDTASTSPSD